MTAPRFPWDEVKNLSTQRKHGVSFELAIPVFLDPLHLSVQDRVEDGEQRGQPLGQIGGVAVVLVSHTFTEDGPQHAEKGRDIKKVEHRLETLPPLTKAQEANLERLAAMPDDEIDYDDIPALTEDQLAEMQRGRFYRPVKKQITARVDADVLAWLKSQGKGYQSRMNEILRDAMLNTK